ncbi:hypothetical protein ACQ4LE_008217 [Meloidogyne hapla]|uniref:LIM zinc-binding domain-containing protein n=1 Tax=Meloidogyne hapla TaxID=6305 RepID=A0A1I8BTQ4_MELHA
MSEIELEGGGGVTVEEDERPGVRETCEQCGEEVVDKEVVMAQGKIWHKGHFRCNNPQCDIALQEDFQIHNSLPYCIKCYIAIVRPKCANETCSDRMFGAMFYAVGKYWHAQCFQCAGCGKPLAGGKHFVIQDLPYDLDCHWVKRLAIQNGEDIHEG